MKQQDNLLKIFNAAIDAVKPARLLVKVLQRKTDRITIAGREFLLNEYNNLKLLAIGKAATGMALVAQKILGDAITVGLCITKTAHAQIITGCTCIEAGHPIPNNKSLLASKAIEKFVANTANDSTILLVLLSGGASSLVADLPKGIQLSEIKSLNKQFVNSGANIEEINTVRKHFSTLKGGQLARLANSATIITLAISDVAADYPSVIGSGLTAPDNSSFNDTNNVLVKYGLLAKLPEALKTHLNKGLHGLINENPTSGNVCFEKSGFHILANNQTGLSAAENAALKLTKNCLVFPNGLNGNMSLITDSIVQKLLHYRGSKPACFIWGGEPLLKVNKSGKGGRCHHLALAVAARLNEETDINHLQKIGLLAGATDGTDGTTETAGTIHVWQKNAPKEYHQQLMALQNFKAFNYWKKRDALLITGPTQTNVNDIFIAWLE